MARVRIRYYRVRWGRGFWEPTRPMRAAGFRLKPLGPDGPDAWAEAERLNGLWDQARSNKTKVVAYSPGTPSATFFSATGKPVYGPHAS